MSPEGTEKPRDSETDKFAEVLGLPKITMEQLMKSQQAPDEVVEDALNQDANFIKTQEGYPLFFRDLNDSLSKV